MKPRKKADKAQERIEENKIQAQKKSILRQQEDLLAKSNEIKERHLEEEIDRHSQVNSRTLKQSEPNLKFSELGHQTLVQHPYFDTAPSIGSFLPKNETVPFSRRQTCPPLTLNDVLIRQNEISTLILKSQQKANLPKHSPENFDGTDITKYRSFMLSFERVIEARCEDDVDRLYYLEKYTSGLPLQLVHSCRNRDTALAYREAKLALEKEYGNKYRVTNAYMSRMNQWKPIKNEDPKALQDLSIFLFS